MGQENTHESTVSSIETKTKREKENPNIRRHYKFFDHNITEANDKSREKKK